jgi:hypothetical protein
MNRVRTFTSVSALPVIFAILGLLQPLPAYASHDPSPVGAVAIDPLDPMTLYAATGGGVFKSTDGGTTWTLTSLTNGGVSSLEVAPRADAAEPTTLFVGTYDGVVFKSSDGGATWSLIFSPSRRGPVATVGSPWPCPPFPAACPCRFTIAAPSSPLTDPSVRNCRTRFFMQGSPCWPRRDRCAAGTADDD